MPRVHSPGQRACLGAESTLGRRSPAYVFDSTYFHPQSPRQPHRTPLRARVAPAPAQKQGQNPRVCMAPSQEAGELGAQSSLGSHTPRQWVGMSHTRPPIPRYLPKTPAESQGRRLARQKSLPPSVSGLKSPEKTRFRQSFPCETTSRTLNRGRTSSVSGSIGPCVGSLNSQDTHHVRDTLVCHPYVQRFEI